jgi:hypothetical protein
MPTITATASITAKVGWGLVFGLSTNEH